MKPEMHVEDKGRMKEILEKGGSLISAGRTLRRDPEIIELALSKDPKDIAFVTGNLQEIYQKSIDSTSPPFVTDLTAEDLSSVIDRSPLAKQELKNEGDNSMAFEICEIHDGKDNRHFNQKLGEFICDPSIEHEFRTYL